MDALSRRFGSRYLPVQFGFPNVDYRVSMRSTPLHAAAGTRNRRIGRGSLAAAILLSACTANETVPPVPTLGSPTTIATAAPSATRCVVVSGPTGSITRYLTPPGTSWWVAVGVIDNRCQGEVTLTGVAVGAAVGGALVVRGFKVAPTSDAPVDAVAKASDQQAPPFAPAVVAAKTSSAVFALVIVGQDASPQPMPEVTIRWQEPAGNGSMSITSATRLCPGAPPKS